LIETKDLNALCCWFRRKISTAVFWRKFDVDEHPADGHEIFYILFYGQTKSF
jgi:hypothetical protein